MGKIRKGILGGFSGTVGTVVGANWRGIAYMRSLPQKVKNPKTLGQRTQRNKFAVTLAFLQPLTGFLRVGWKLYAYKRTPFNAAMSYTIANAITGTYPNFTIDASQVLVSRGALSPASNANASPTPGGNISITWQNNSGSTTANEDDKALIAIINQNKGEAVFDTAGTRRDSTNQNMTMPMSWVGEQVNVYLGFISADEKQVSNSVYLGQITVS